MDDKDDVGYKKPPRHTRFKPGLSGNPRGRTRKNGPSLYEALAIELSKKISYTEAGRSRSSTKRELLAVRLINDALSGNSKAASLIINMFGTKFSEQTDSLSPILHELRRMHAKHESGSLNGRETGGSSDSPTGAVSADCDSNND